MKRTIKNAIVLAATLFGSIVLPASAMAQSAPDPDQICTESLEAIAKVWGDSDGHLRATDAAGGTTILAHGASTWVVYTSGDNVSASDDFALCVEDPAQGLSSCDPVDGNGAGTECRYGWCNCSGTWLSCLDLIAICSVPMVCDWDGCSCPVW